MWFKTGKKIESPEHKEPLFHVVLFFVFLVVFFSLDTVYYCDIKIPAKYFLPKMDQIKSRSQYHLMGDSSLS